MGDTAKLIGSLSVDLQANTGDAEAAFDRIIEKMERIIELGPKLNEALDLGQA